MAAKFTFQLLIALRFSLLLFLVLWYKLRAQILTGLF